MAMASCSQRQPCYTRWRTLLQSCPLRRKLRQAARVQAIHGGSAQVVVVSTPAADAAQSRVHEKIAACSDDSEDERMCRYCFEGDEAGELISPCKCTGGQKYVHLTCLRMWQRAVLISQPTHPDFYGSDSRQRVCNVCKSQFTCPPPTRMELMAWMTGPEIPALIEEGCIIASAEDFSQELENQISGLPFVVQNHGLVCRNWIRGVFFIVKVVPDRDSDERLLRLSDQEDVAAFLEKLDEDAASIHLRGRKFRVSLAEGSGNYEEASPAERRAAIRALDVPFSVKLRPDVDHDRGEDGVVAVNLTRTLSLSDPSCPEVLLGNIREKVSEAESAVLLEGECPKFQVQHFIGGPCEETDIGAAIVVNSTTKTYQVLNGARSLEKAFELAEREASGVQSDTCDTGRGIMSTSTTASEEPANKRQRVTDATGEASEHDDDEGSGGDDTEMETHSVHVLVFWGYAGWSRCQLMGEIARGSWGLCKGEASDVLSLGGADLWPTTYPRLTFAPKNEMSETYNRERPGEEQRQRQLRRMSLFHLFLRNNTPTRPAPDAGPNEDTASSAGSDEDVGGEALDLDELPDVEEVEA